MEGYRLPKRVLLGELETAGQHGSRGKEKEWTDCVAEDRWVFCITRDWSTAALDYTKGVSGFWPRGGGERKRYPKSGRDRAGKGGQS